MAQLVHICWPLRATPASHSLLEKHLKGHHKLWGLPGYPGFHSPCCMTSREWLDFSRVQDTEWRQDSHRREGGFKEGIHPQASGTWYSNNVSSILSFFLLPFDITLPLTFF